jgi:hypothetical protein
MVVVRASKGRLAGLFLLSVLFVAGGGVLAGVHSNPFARVVGGVGVLFFGLCGGMILRKLAGPRIALVLDRHGLIDNGSAAPAGRIAWEEITRVAVVEFMGQRFLSLDVKDREALYARARVARILKANASLMGYPVNLTANILERPVDEVAREVERFWREPEARARLGVFEPGSSTG